MKEKHHIFLASPHMSEEAYEQMYVKEAFDSNWIAPLGKNVDEFEREIERKLQAKAAVALVSGTAALHLALKSIGVEAGDLVFCSSLTFSATANPIIYQGAEPVFLDSEFGTWNMSPAALAYAFDKYEKQGRKPKAVILVHLYGMAANLNEILRICREHNCPLIEDAAESLGTTYTLQDGTTKYTGTFGDYGVISFNGNKIITSSGGGMLLCNTYDAKERAKKARFWATQAKDAASWYEHTELGYNYRMSNVAAGIGRGQLCVLEERIWKKRFIYEFYQRAIGELRGLSFMPLHDNTRCNCWLTAAQLEEEYEVSPFEIMLALEKEDIESRLVWKPMHLQPYYKKYDFITGDSIELQIVDKEMGADNSVAGTLFRRGICLPSDTKMDEEDLNRIVSIIKGLWSNE